MKLADEMRAKVLERKKAIEASYQTRFEEHWKYTVGRITQTAQDCESCVFVANLGKWCGDIQARLEAEGFKVTSHQGVLADEDGVRPHGEAVLQISWETP